jgi:hypothetical protein
MFDRGLNHRIPGVLLCVVLGFSRLDVFPPTSTCVLLLIRCPPAVPQVVTQTQSGPALVIDLTASPFYEPGPLPQCLAALLGLAVTPQEDPAAAAAEAAPAAAAAAGSNALAVSALSALQAGEWKRAEQLTKGLKVRQAGDLLHVSCLWPRATQTLLSSQPGSFRRILVAIVAPCR